MHGLLYILYQQQPTSNAMSSVFNQMDDMYGEHFMRRMSHLKHFLFTF